MPRLIWVFAGRTVTLLVLSSRLKWALSRLFQLYNTSERSARGREQCFKTVSLIITAHEQTQYNGVGYIYITSWMIFFFFFCLQRISFSELCSWCQIVWWPGKVSPHNHSCYEYIILLLKDLPRRYFCCGSLFLMSVFILWFSYYVSDIFFFLILGSWMSTYLGKSCSFGLPRVPFVNCRQFMYLVISLLVLRAGCGIWLYQFLIIAYLFTLGREKMSRSFSKRIA